MSPHEKTGDTTTATPEDATTDAPIDPNYLKGLKLYLVVFGVSISYFLILLNSTVVVTVCQSGLRNPAHIHSPLSSLRPFHQSQTTSTPFKISDGMAAHIS